MRRTGKLYAAPDMVAVDVPAIRSSKEMAVNGRVVPFGPATGGAVVALIG